MLVKNNATQSEAIVLVGDGYGNDTALSEFVFKRQDVRPKGLKGFFCSHG